MQDKSSTPSIHTRTAGEDRERFFTKDPAINLFPIVAIGAASGGPKAVCRLLDRLSSNLGMAYVIILHLPQEEVSIEQELQQHTRMPIHQARNNMPLEKDHIYILTPDSCLGIGSAQFINLPLFRLEKEWHIIDHFFASLANAYRSNTYAIILSGTGPDGTAGVRAIRREGGITFAQDNTAAFTSMPQTAIESGFIDFVASPEGIAEQLTALKNYSLRHKAILTSLETNKAQLSRIYLLLSEAYAVDFSLYQPSILNRRIIRRMTINKIPDLEAYLNHLEAHPTELNLLYKDLLSGVGGFFRDPGLNRMLARKIYPLLIKDRHPNDPIRIWLPACSGGENACTLAISILEFMKGKNIHFPIQIFATDLNENTISLARTGSYSRASLQHISPIRVKKFFAKVEGGYQVNKEIRDICVFAIHDFLKDPPFARMDIVSCQDLLMSLQPAAQQKGLKAFHYALKPAGYLLLGRNDMVDQTEPYFTRVYKDWNIYTKKPVLNIPSNDTVIPGSLSLKRDRAADQLLLSRYVPAGILIDRNGLVIRFYGAAGSYLKPPAGKASLHLFKMLNEDMTSDIQTMIEQVNTGGAAIKRTNVPFTDVHGVHELTIEVTPVRQAGETLLLIIIDDHHRRKMQEEQKNTPSHSFQPSPEQRRILHLEESLRAAGRQILQLHEEYDRASEEIQTAHEEILSSNEELLSINEELQTSKQELEATNEELMTINQELQQRNEDLKESVEYAEAIIETIRQPLLDLYSDLRIRKANKAFYTFFDLQPETTEGHYLSELASGLLDIPELIQQLRQTISRRLPFEDLEWKFNTPSSDERILLFNALRINGQPGKRARILLGFEDITERKLLERKKDEFIGIASHELKTPATSIQAYTQILYNEFVEANDQRSAQLVSKLNNQVTRLTNLTKDLLDMTKITQGQLRLNPAYFDLHTLISQIVEEMQRITPHRIIFSPEPFLPRIWADRERLGQVLQNLISNALRYSNDNDSIIIALHHHHGRIDLSVRDFGIGIDPDIKEKIFQRWFRSQEPHVTGHPGLGLGLYISSEIIRQHGGDIHVDTEKGKGSVFIVSLPLKHPT